MAINLGNTSAVDFYSGNTPVDRIYLGQSKIYDAFTEISGTLPLRYNARRAENLKNYQVYGTAEGSGVETENILVFSDLMNAPSGTPAGSSSVYDHLLILEVEPNTEYTLASDGVGSTSGTSDISRCIYFNSNKSENTVFKNHPVIATSSATGNLYIGFISSRTNAQQYINGTAHVWLVKGSTAPSTYIPHGYKLPLTVENGTQSQNIPVYIDDSKLGAEEYVDYDTQKIYKRTINLWSFEGKEIGQGSTFISTTFTLKPNTTYTMSSEAPLYDGGALIVFGKVGDIGNTQQNGVYAGRPITRTTDNTGVVFVSLRTNNSGYDITKFKTCLIEGSAPPETYIPYLDPTDPPIPFPPIPAYQGENILSSMETLGEMILKGRISETLSV